MCDASTPVKGSDSKTLKSSSELLNTPITPKIIEGQALTKQDSDSIMYYSSDSVSLDSCSSLPMNEKNDKTSQKEASIKQEELEKDAPDTYNKQIQKAMDVAGMVGERLENVQNISVNMEVCKATKTSYELTGPVEEEVTTAKLSMRLHMGDKQMSITDFQSLLDVGFQKTSEFASDASKPTSTVQVYEYSESAGLKAESASSKKLSEVQNEAVSSMDTTSLAHSTMENNENLPVPDSPTQMKKRLDMERLMTFSTPARRLLSDKTAKIKCRPPIGRLREKPSASGTLDLEKKN